MKLTKLNNIKKENKTMSKEDLRPQEPKTAKTVEVKVALPWTLLVVIAISFACYASGWIGRGNDLDRVKAEAHSLIELTKAPSKQ